MKTRTGLEVTIGFGLIVAGLFLLSVLAVFDQELSLHGLIMLIWGLVWVYTDKLAVFFSRRIYLFYGMIALYTLPLILTILQDLHWIKVSSFVSMDGALIVSILYLLSIDTLEKAIKAQKEGKKK
ncbi:TPA: hypothetical protein ACGO9M_001428 [Streptococcus suis]